MGYYMWRAGAWRRVEVCGRGAAALRFVYAARGALHAARRGAVLRLLRARQRDAHPPPRHAALRRAAELPARPHRCRKARSWPMQPPPPPCCHAAPPPVCQQHQQINQQHQQTNQQHQQISQQHQQTNQQHQQTNQQHQQINQQHQQTNQQHQQTNQQHQQTNPQKTQNEVQRQNKQDSSDTSECKELMLDYKDVTCIKAYVQQHPEVFGKLDNDRFNDDDQYRSAVLYRFQPLVKIERLKSIEKYLSNNMNLKEFAAKLGLRHIDTKRDNRPLYKTRNSNYLDKRFFDKGSNKENDAGNSVGESETASSLELERCERVSQREINNLLNEPKHLRMHTSELKISPRRVRDRDANNANARASRKRKRDDDSDSVSARSGKGSASEGASGAGSEREGASGKVIAKERVDNKKSGRFFTKKDRSNFVRSARAAKPVSFKSGSGREYSSLEDHAIVAWIHNGGRSRLVNGNRVWRQLQQSYCNITNHVRTWQSLRNRYLRHILPSLPDLQLSAATQETLRANAAIGEIKLARKKSLNRRNSIFKADKVCSAWSRQPRTQGQLDATAVPAALSPRRPTRRAASTSHQDEEIERTTRKRADARRNRPNSTESSESDDFQPKPKPTRPNSDERRNNDIKRLAQRMMRAPRNKDTDNSDTNFNNHVPSATKSTRRSLLNVNSVTDKVNKESERKTTRQSAINSYFTNKSSRSPNNVPNRTKERVSIMNRSDDKPIHSPIKTRNSASKQRKAVNNTASVNSSPRAAVDSPVDSPADSPRTGAVPWSNAVNLRSPRTLGGRLYGSPHASASSVPYDAHKPRLSADKHIARGGRDTHRRALYNHRAAAL